VDVAQAGSDKRVRRPVRIAILTVSDSRTLETDRSGATLVARLEAAGHVLADRRIVIDDAEVVRGALLAWCDAPEVEVVIATGGTGITGRDVTADVFEAIYDKAIPGFGELFRSLSYSEIGTSTIQSRATGGLARGTLLFALPGSTGACKTGWDGILASQLDIDHKPCNLVALMPRFDE
jgi:molybdenum cofactor biosynthesis protein B